MASKIKEIAKFSQDAISLAMEGLTDNMSFEEGLDSVVKTLGCKKKQEALLKPPTLTDVDAFLNHILPKIEGKLRAIENAEFAGRLEINTAVDVITVFETLTYVEMAEVHDKLLKLENDFETITIILQFLRGKLYIFMADKIRKDGKSVKSVIEDARIIHVTYRTFLRYMVLANIILKYPRLILCELTFTQLLKHKNRLLDYLESKNGCALRDRLSLPVEITIQQKQIIIDQCEIEALKASFSTGPDWRIADLVRTTPSGDDKAVLGWVKSAAGACATSNEEEELEQSL